MSAAGNIQFIVMALTQVLGVGTMVLIAHAAGRKDQADGNLVFNQSLLLAGIAAVVVFVGGLLFSARYLGMLAADPEVVAIAVQYLRTISWNFVASGIVFTCSGMFQAMGNTVPSAISSAVRVVVFVVPALYISRVPGFQLHWLWYVSVVSTTVHALFALWLLKREALQRGAQ